MLERLRAWAREVRRDVAAIGLCARDRRVPWYAKALAGLVVAYALSPIDLIPDFIPVLGYLDDAILVPLGILLVIRLIPPEVLAEKRRLAEAREANRGAGWIGSGVVIAIWLLAVVLVVRMLGFDLAF